MPQSSNAIFVWIILSCREVLRAEALWSRFLIFRRWLAEEFAASRGHALLVLQFATLFQRAVTFAAFGVHILIKFVGKVARSLGCFGVPATHHYVDFFLVI